MKNILYILLALPVFALGQTGTENYVKTATYSDETATSDPDKAQISVTYFDGLGRQVQQVAYKASPTGNDMITHIEYDQYNRQTKEYMPYVSASATMEFDLAAKLNTTTFYGAKFPGTTNPYNEKSPEASPLSRLFEEGAPGESWKVNTGSDSDHTIKYDYQTNRKWEVRKFSVVFLEEDLRHEKTKLECIGYYVANQLYKSIVKNENWKPGDGKSNTTEQFTDRAGKMILKRNYAKNATGLDVAHDTYYVYDDYNNLSYVIPPLASDDLFTVNDHSSQSGRNYPWVKLALVDQKLSDEYEKDLSAYNNADILNVDLMSKYGGQGGFTISSDTQGKVSLKLNITVNDTLNLRTGIIADLTDLGSLNDQEIGHMQGSGYDYYFLVVDGNLEVSGSGGIPAPKLNLSLTGGTPLEYNMNYPWTRLCTTDPVIAKAYEDAISTLDNSQILNTYTANSYGASGGINISIDHEDTVTVSLNMATDTPLDLQTGVVFPLDIYRRIGDRDLGTVSGIYNGLPYNYTLSIANNSLNISGSGQFGHIVFVDSRNSSPTYTVNQAVVDGLCYRYHYDKRNRLVEKKVPGKDWEYMVYDRLDRLIAFQDAGLRVRPYWRLSLYDALNRVVLVSEAPDDRGRADFQDYFDGLVNPSLNLTRNYPGSYNTAQGLYINYSPNNVVPQIGSVLLLNYYDDYNYDKAGIGVPTTNQYGTALTTNAKGLLTGTKVRTITTGTTAPTWTTSITGFEAKGRQVWSDSKNGYLNTENVSDAELDFTGKPKNTRTVHKRSGLPDLVAVDHFEYDAMQRLLKQTQAIGGNPAQLIVFNKYNDIGQLEGKKVGDTDVSSGYALTTGLQTIDYTYNIRGWMLGINATTDNLATSADLFAFSLKYETGNIPLYNGNISEASWKSKTDNKLRGYNYEYDALNRLTKANYVGNYELGQYPGQFENFTEGPVTYDKNGNIKTLERWGLKANNQVNLIDVLSYSYFSYSNQLRGVNDTADSNGFNNNGTGANADYSYDLSGNMLTDKNKGIISPQITYNRLNLPTRIRFSATKEIDYMYDAAGMKLEKKVIDGGTTVITQYDGGYVYLDGVLQYFPHSEGYVEVGAPVTGEYKDFKYIYQYKDHLGSVRLSYFKNGSALEVVKEDNYYAFGMQHTGYNNVVSSNGNASAQKKLYNGKEVQDELGLNWYDYQARNYDPVIGRWMNIDPLAEKMRRFSPYAFALDNPVYYIDPDGMEATPGDAGPGGATGYLSELGADIRGVQTMYYGDLGKKKAGWKAGAEAKLLKAINEFNNFVASNPGINSGNENSLDNGGIKPENKLVFEKREANNSEILSRLNPNVDGSVLKRFQEANFEENTILWFSHGSSHGIAGGMSAQQFDKYLMKNSEVYRNAIKNKTPLTLKLFACYTGMYGGLAEQLSAMHSNLTIWAPDNTIVWPVDGTKPYIGLEKDEVTGKREYYGTFHIYENGSTNRDGQFKNK